MCPSMGDAIFLISSGVTTEAVGTEPIFHYLKLKLLNCPEDNAIGCFNNWTDVIFLSISKTGSSKTINTLCNHLSVTSQHLPEATIEIQIMVMSLKEKRGSLIPCVNICSSDKIILWNIPFVHCVNIWCYYWFHK